MSDRLRQALAGVAASQGAADLEFTLEQPRDPSHGDLATNLAMQLAKRTRANPRALADHVVAALDLAAAGVASAEIAGPGFINFRLAGDTFAADCARILAEGPNFGRSVAPAPQRVNVEFVSANPTGPLHVGHGRGAAIGDVIATLLEWTGHDVTREFYINDAGVQIARVAESLWARVQQAVGREAAIPEGGYHGVYLVENAAELLRTEGRAFADLPAEAGIARCRAAALRMQRIEQDETLATFGVRFDVMASEQGIYDDGKVQAALDRLAAAGLSYEQDGALWLRTSSYGDEKDRVLRKQDGSYTYFVPDIAYHLDKHARGFTRAIDVWGADHHGYIPRVRGALVALGLPTDWLEVSLVQLVKVVRDGEEVKMSKRSGEFVTLRDLYEETGVDAARWWFLMRRGDTHLTFDIALATKASDENPVYYVQMAHARMAGILRNAGFAPDAVDWPLDVDAIGAQDLDLLRKCLAFPEQVARAARDLEPHRITGYLEELARTAHGWYHGCRVLGEPEPTMRARLLLARTARQVLANGLTLVGVSAPDRI
ncbi:MAG TPA: arginine--tRNA ligase [Gemmatimonadales bacterium]|nr:arginine--tRNA ligase [Gemmatimonadales bacterium]